MVICGTVRSELQLMVSIYCPQTRGCPVVFDGVQEEPPAQTYVGLYISYDSFTVPTVAVVDSNLEAIKEGKFKTPGGFLVVGEGRGQ